MINTPTVFILGAGSNTNYGFPSGKELVDEICRPINRTSYNDHKETTLSSEQLRSYGIDPRAYQTFQKELIESRLSVDLFIENRPEFDEIGRKAIAINLLKCESSDRLFWGEWQYLHFENKRVRQGSESWYDLLWSHLTSPFTFDNFSNNKLAIITFNYDRSLEHFLFTALRRSSGKTDIECAEAVKTIRILHVYGSLGPLLWQDASGVPYDSQASPTAVTSSQQHIRLIRSNEHKDSSPEFEEAHRLLEKAARVFILGFGFDYTNIRRLKLPQLLRDKEVWATSLGLSKSVKEVIIKGLLLRRVREQTKDVGGIVDSDYLIDCTVYALLQNNVSIY